MTTGLVAPDHRDIRRASLALAAWALALVLASPPVAQAQYFGQNKVRYGDFEFRVLSTEHFDIYYYDREERAIEEAARIAERWYARLSRLLDHQLRGRQPLILYASPADFRQTTVIPGFIGPTTGGVTEAPRNRIVLPFTASLAETDHVIGHELVHAFQFDMTQGEALGLPLWFVEGLIPLPLRTCGLAYLAGRWGDEVVPALFIAAAKIGDPIAALEQLTGESAGGISRAWHDAIAATYAPLHASAEPAPGRTLVARKSDEGRSLVGLSLSPDGTRVVFFSERDLFSIEMFLADARTGEIVRRLTDLATDPHLDSIEFLDSTGAWDAEGRRFVYSSSRRGVPVLVIVSSPSAACEAASPTFISSICRRTVWSSSPTMRTRSFSRRGLPTARPSRWLPISSRRACRRWHLAPLG